MTAAPSRYDCYWNEACQGGALFLLCLDGDGASALLAAATAP